MRNELTHDEEEHLIRCVQAGDDSAWEQLSQAYEPMLRAIAKRVDGASEEAYSTALTYLYLKVMAHESGRLGKYKWDIENATRSDCTLDAVVSAIPHRTWCRYWSIMDKANDDAIQAFAICTRYHMSQKTFLRIHALAHAERGTDVEPEYLEPSELLEDEDPTHLASVALATLDHTEERVVRHKYMGPGGVEPDALVAYILACVDLSEERAQRGERTYPWWTVRYLRRTAMAKMRQALGV